MVIDKNISTVLAVVKEELTRVFLDRLSRIVLFGSYARGDYRPGSDIDIMVLIADTPSKIYDNEMLRIMVDLSIQYDVDLSIIVKNVDEFKGNLSVLPLYRNISKEGIQLYAA